MNKSVEFWRPHIEALHEQGLSIAAYGREHGLSVHALQWWRRKLNRVAAGPVKSSKSGFVALRIGAPVAPVQMSCRLSLGLAQLELPSVPAPEWLAALSRALQQAR